MLCRNPFVSAGIAFGCGQCMPCRYNRRRIWQHRIMIECGQHSDNAFVTLTYSDDKLPPLDSLVPRDIQLFLKRLRERVNPSRFRFFAVGEYGDETGRPHYHVGLFGFRSCSYGQSRYSKRVVSCCYWCDLVRDTWGKGNVYLGKMESDSAGYICGYVVKKMTGKDDPRLRGRFPEFARMSLKPGIGASGMWDVADVLLTYDLVPVDGDVPSGLRHGRSELPLGRYLKKLVRRYVGRDEKAPQSVLDEVQAELRPMQLAARSDEVNPSFKSKLVEAGSVKVAQIEARSKIYRKRRGL